MRNRDSLALAAFALALFFATFAIGSVHRWAVVIGAFLTLLSCAVFITSRRRLSESAPPLLVFLGVCTALTALQVIPLPAAVVGLLSSAKYDLVRDNAVALHASMPSFFALSLDPPATLKELVKLISYLGFAYACLRIATSRASRILQFVAALGSAVALTALVHQAFGATKLYGLYDPEYAKQPIFLAPLLNPNHLCGLMALCSSVALGLAIDGRGKQRTLSIVALLLCAGVGLLTGSRGGIVAMIAGLLLTAAMSVHLKRRGTREPLGDSAKKSVRIAQFVVGICVLAWLAMATGSGVLKEFEQTKAQELTGEIGKLELWRASLPIIANNSAIGIGRGAFEPAITQIRNSQYSHASLENEYLQALVDWGLLGGALAAAALVLLALAALRGAKISPLEAGAMGGLAALAAQNLVDFSLSLPGVALPAIAALAVLTRGKLERTKSQKLKMLRIGLLIVGIGLTASLALPAGTQDRDEVCSTPCSLSESEHIWDRHPGSYAAAGRVAMVLRRQNDPRAIAVLNRALARNPYQWGLHLLAARWLSESQAQMQALVEYGSVLQYAPLDKVPGLLAELLAKFPDAQQAIQGLPNTPTRIRYFTNHLRNLKRPELALAYAKRLWEVGSETPELLAILSNLAAEANDFELALRAASYNCELVPGPESSYLLANIQGLSGDATLALATLSRIDSTATIPAADQVQHLLLKSKLLISLDKRDEARDSLEAALQVPLTTPGSRVTIHTAISKLEDLLGNHNQAEIHRKQAAALRQEAEAKKPKSL